MGEGRITNLILSQKIDGIIKEQKELKEYIKECNESQNKQIEANRVDVKANAVAIAGVKGASGVIASIVSTISALIISTLLTRHS